MNTTTKAASVLCALLLFGCQAATGLPAGDPSTQPQPSLSPITPVTPAPSGQATREVIVHDEIAPMTIVLDLLTVLCSSADYSATFLKVLIPQIAEVAVLDHTNAGAAAPCIAAGECTLSLNPRTIIDPVEQTQAIELRVLRTMVTIVDHDQQTCQVSLREELFTTIRGVAFYHLRERLEREPAYADCLEP